MHKKQLQMLKKIMALEFTVLELNLYLDTHPCDEEALDDHQKYTCKLKDIKRNYQKKYGPLTANCCQDQYPWESGCEQDYEYEGKYLWDYIESPWPWQINY